MAVLEASAVGRAADGRHLQQVQSGDVLAVTKLDRLGRSAAHLARLVSDLVDQGVTLKSLAESIDTSTAAGKFMVHMLTALAPVPAPKQPGPADARAVAPVS